MIQIQHSAVSAAQLRFEKPTTRSFAAAIPVVAMLSAAMLLACGNDNPDSSSRASDSGEVGTFVINSDMDPDGSASDMGASDSANNTDSQVDGGMPDLNVPSDTGQTDTTTGDIGGEDGGTDGALADILGEDAGADVGGEDAGADVADVGKTCETDTDCEEGAEWCVGGLCIPCDDDAELCRIDCPFEWTLYERNGCSPCACAPLNECVSDAECDESGDFDGPATCYAGQFCTDWCPEGDPSCCFGNFCSESGCDGPPTEPILSCAVRGCPEGEICGESEDCSSGGCSCEDFGDGPIWSCNRDCHLVACQVPIE